jgi:hypothetical protein
MGKVIENKDKTLKLLGECAPMTTGRVTLFELFCELFRKN